MEKEMVGTAEILQTAQIGRKTFVLMADENDAFPYSVSERKDWLMGYSYEDTMASADYIKVYQEFLNRQKAELDRIKDCRSQWKSDGIPYTAADCIPDSQMQSYKNQVVVYDASVLPPELRVKEEQLLFVEGGFGSEPKSRGRKVFCRDCMTGEKLNLNRNDISGILLPELLPEWAKKSVQQFKQEQVRKGAER